MICEHGHPRGSVYPLDDDSGITGWVCVNCGATWKVDKNG